ncbi:MAG: hypothetical protein K6T75_08535 [Acetobacteraceae bacterium]|nr:hypothetical protein [Acetobacteraceae bacterium]
MPGTFDRAVRGIREAVEWGIPVWLKFVVSRRSLEYLPWAVEETLALRVQKLLFTFLVPEGRARGLQQLCLTPAEYLGVLREVTRLRGTHLGGPDLELKVRLRRDLLAHPCQAGACDASQCHRGLSPVPRSLHVTADGDVLPLGYYVHPSYRLGHLGKARLREMVAAYPGSPQHRDLLRLCRETYRSAVVEGAEEAVHWNHLIGRATREHPRAAAPVEGVGVG